MTCVLYSFPHNIIQRQQQHKKSKAKKKSIFSQLVWHFIIIVEVEVIYCVCVLQQSTCENIFIYPVLSWSLLSSNIKTFFPLFMVHPTDSGIIIRTDFNYNKILHTTILWIWLTNCNIWFLLDFLIGKLVIL